MSGIGQNEVILGEEAMSKLPRRNRTPSKYAESIRQLAKMSQKQSKKERISSSNEQDSDMCAHHQGNNGNTLSCILPGSGKKLRLSVIIKKSQKPKLIKKVSKPIVAKQKPKELPKGKSLLDTLLEACEQVKEEESNKMEKDRKGGEFTNNSESQRREIELRKQREQEEKYFKLYEKYQSLQAKLQQNQTEIVFI